MVRSPEMYSNMSYKKLADPRIFWIFDRIRPPSVYRYGLFNVTISGIIMGGLIGYVY